MNPELLARAYQLRAQASIIAEGPGVSFIPKGDREYESKDPTTGAGGDTFSLFAHRLAKCRSDHDLEGFIEALESELQAIRKRPVAPKVKTKMEVLYGCWSRDYYTAVARASGVGGTTIRRWRSEVGQDPYWGEKAA